MKLTVSVIITTKNEEKNIRACLQSIRDQSYEDIEIIVVDNHSSDATKRIAGKFTKKIYDKGPERSAQRNFGASRASGEYVFFMDADMILTKNVISDCMEVVKRGKVLAVVVAEQSFGEGYWARCKILERNLYLGVDWIEAARFFRKDVFQKIGGYDESLTGPEDFDLPQRIKEIYGTSAISRTSEFILHNEGHLSLYSTLKKKFYYGQKLNAYKNKVENTAYAKKQFNVFGRYSLFFTQPEKLFHDPIVGIGMLVMKTLEMGALAVGYFFGIVRRAN